MMNFGKADDLERFEAELDRIATLLDKADRPDPLDLAVLHLLRARAVRDLLDPVLQAGGRLKAVVLQPAGSVEGVVQFDVQTAWREGTSHVSGPPVVSAVVALDPPEVLRVARRDVSPEVERAPLTTPSGPLPTTLAHITGVRASEALRGRVGERRAIVEFLNREQFNTILGEVSRLNSPDTAFGLTSGSYCTSLFCFERYSDDFDDPAGAIGGFVARTPFDPYD